MKFPALALNLALLGALCGAPATASAAVVFSNIYAFGDSLTDTGNTSLASGGAYPGAAYYNGRYSDGPLWIETMAGNLGLAAPTPSLAGGNNFAFAGAYSATGGLVPTISQQITMFTGGGGFFQSTDLVVLWGGANDFIPGGQTDPTIPASNSTKPLPRKSPASRPASASISSRSTSTPSANNCATIPPRMDSPTPPSQPCSPAMGPTLQGISTGMASTPPAESTTFSPRAFRSQAACSCSASPGQGGPPAATAPRRRTGRIAACHLPQCRAASSAVGPAGLSRSDASRAGWRKRQQGCTQSKGAALRMSPPAAPAVC